MLSVIIPFAQEHPQLAFTVQSIYNELTRAQRYTDDLEFEIVVIDNHCLELENQMRAAGHKPDGGSEYIASLAKDRDWLQYFQYNKKLSHWQAKNLGVFASRGDILFFCDAHCVPSINTLAPMHMFYSLNWQDLHGTLHLPLSYMLEKPGRELIYKMVNYPEHAVYHYSFTKYRYNEGICYTVPAMSTCGMMMHRSIYDYLGGWPTELGIYGGGENFINFTLGVMGYNKWIFPTEPLYHYAAPRGYSWNYDDYHRNRAIATMMFGSRELSEKYLQNIRGHEIQKRMLIMDVLGNEETLIHAQSLWKKHTMTIDEWSEQWKESV